MHFQSEKEAYSDNEIVTVLQGEDSDSLLTLLPIRRHPRETTASRRSATNSQLPEPRGIATSSPDDADTKDQGPSYATKRNNAGSSSRALSDV